MSTLLCSDSRSLKRNNCDEVTPKASATAAMFFSAGFRSPRSMSSMVMASEFDYFADSVDKNTLVLFVSQSGLSNSCDRKRNAECDFLMN